MKIVKQKQRDEYVLHVRAFVAALCSNDAIFGNNSNEKIVSMAIDCADELELHLKEQQKSGRWGDK